VVDVALGRLDRTTCCLSRHVVDASVTIACMAPFRTRDADSPTHDLLTRALCILLICSYALKSMSDEHLCLSWV